MTGLAPAVILWLLTIVGVVAAYTDWGDDNDGAVDEHGQRIVPGEEPREWSYVGCPDEVTDSRGRRYCHHTEHYQPRCRPCHHRYDYKGRRPNGQWLSREEVMPHV